MYREYAPLDFSVDSGFISGIILFFISTYYYLIGHPSYTAANMLNSFLGSTLMTFWGLSGLYSMVKGQMAPSMAIQQTHSVFSIILGVVFLGLDVTVSQILAALGIIIGCAFIKLYH
jgi:drug/metabolite transporter (DMT)-like permease